MANGNGVWKYVAVSSVSVLMGLGIQIFREPKNTVSKDELPGLVLQYSPYTADSKDIKTKLDALTVQQTRAADEQVRTTDQIHQLQIDTARIAEKLGIPASPGVALKSRENK